MGRECRVTGGQLVAYKENVASVEDIRPEGKVIMLSFVCLLSSVSKIKLWFNFSAML